MLVIPSSYAKTHVSVFEWVSFHSRHWTTGRCVFGAKRVIGDFMPRIKKQHLKKRPDGRFVAYYHEKAFYGKTEEEAFAARDEFKRSEITGEAYNRIVTVFEYGNKWLKIAHPAVSDSTFKGLAIHLQHLVNQQGNTPIRDVKPLDIKAVYSVEYKAASNSYIKSAKQLYIALFDSAVADGICRFNPARQKSAQPHKGTEGGHRSITEQERQWINTFCHDHRAYPAVITMLYAGIRPQEVKALTVEKAYDQNNNVLHITETAHLDGNNKYQITGKGKTKNAIRDVPVFPPVEEALKGRKGLLITTAKGKQITVTTWRNAYNSYKTCMETAINGCHKRWYGKTKEHKKILEAGGKLPEWIEFTVVPYDLRHSFCTMCRDNGVELHTCIEWMGHADATMIMKIYDEVSDGRSKAEAEKLKKRLFPGQNGGQAEKTCSEHVEK